MRSGAGLVTAAVPRRLNLTLQKKIANVIMTMPLAQNRQGAFSFKALDELKRIWDRYDAVGLGPGLGRDASVVQLARRFILDCPKPLVVDADALFALAKDTSILLKPRQARILTPHPGEMSRLTGQSIDKIENSRLKTARDFAKAHHCVLLLKGHRTIVANPAGKTYVNKTGNAGMATAGSGDVLTGMITAFLGQGMEAFEAAKYGAYYHGKAGDLAARKKGSVSMIASDIIDQIPHVL